MIEETKPNTAAKPDGMLWPLALSAALLSVTAVYIFWKVWNPKADEWMRGDFLGMMKFISIADVGQFVSGIAGALVFIWIIYTYRAQREELALQRDEMKAQRKEFEKLASEAHSQSQLLEQTAATNKRDTFIRYLELRERAMSLIAADLLRMTVTTGDHNAALDNAWRQYNNGDPYAFFRALTAQVVRGEHANFMMRVSNVMTARSWVAVLGNEAARILADAKEVDHEMYRLCFNAPWRSLGEVFQKLLKDDAEGV